MNIKDDNLLYMLETLAAYEPSDIEGDEFEVGFETIDGCDHWTDCSIVDVASKAVELIKRQQKETNNARSLLEVAGKRIDQLEVEIEILETQGKSKFLTGMGVGELRPSWLSSAKDLGVR